MDQVHEDILALLAMDLDRYYEQLMSIYWQQLRAFVLRRTGNEQDTEDILLIAFERAYYALRGFPSERVLSMKIRPWLYKIALSVYYKHVNQSDPPTAILYDAREEDSPLLELEVDRHEQPEEIFESVERRCELEALVATLPETYREMVSMYYFDDFSHQEIADLLNQRVGTVKVYVHRGIRLLRKALAIQTNEVS
jgi:RNA polymerase sigma-70 factor, ECF subfamily